MSRALITITCSPVLMCCVNWGRCLPRRTRAMFAARRPSVCPRASTRNQRCSSSSGHHPINQRRLLKISHTVEPCRDPISAIKHVPCDLCLDRIDVVHQVRRAWDVGAENEAGCHNNVDSYLDKMHCALAEHI